MAFHSVLFTGTDIDTEELSPESKDWFIDLNLDQIVNAILSGREEYNLKPFFYTRLVEVNAIQYRHEIMQDLEHGVLFEQLKNFAQAMRSVRQYRAYIDKLRHKYHRQGWFLETTNLYCETVLRLAHDLDHADIISRGLRTFREYVKTYVESDHFTLLNTATKKLKADLSSVRYALLIKGHAVTVVKYDSEIDYSADVEQTFARFKQGSVKDYRVAFSTGPDMNHVEELILDRVARLYSDIFVELDHYCAQNADYLDETITVFDREIQFYMAYLEHVAPLKRAGLKFCYPKVTPESKEVYGYDVFDLALANKLLGESLPTVCNDFYLKDPERIFVVSGPNQGGKTTFARTFGQLHYLASIGCPVPGSEAQLFLCDRIFTHFEKEESIENLRGKLLDDLIRIHEVLSLATARSLIIMNEIFTSTTLSDAVFLSRQIIGQIVQMDVLCVCVTFIDELASFSEKTVSMVSTVVPENPALRTYKIVRKPPDGLSYAISIAAKHGLTYEHLQERLKT